MVKIEFESGKTQRAYQHACTRQIDSVKLTFVPVNTQESEGKVAMTYKGWINGVPVGFSFVEIVERKPGDGKWRKVFRPSFLACTAVFIMFVLFICNVAVNEPYIYHREWSVTTFMQSFKPATVMNCTVQAQGSAVKERPIECSKPGKREGTETLPSGIVEATSDLERRHLWKVSENDAVMSQNLLAMAVGIKQKRNVDKIIQKFPADNFTIMLFHYDGQVDAWMDMDWSPQAIHVMAANQTKWWYAKRFLHPDIVARYNYIFLWDEDLGVENFHADRYLNIMEDEGLEISQPALASSSSEVHHRLTVRQPRERVHRRLITGTGWNSCNANSTGPPCTGWVEMMAPVFSRAAWRCTWYMIQNDLVHAWGLDYKLGYCAQGVRSEKVGIIDSEYIVHEGIPSLGGQPHDKTAESQITLKTANVLDASLMDPDAVDTRGEIRNRSKVELQAFSRRWRRAAASDSEWMDPFKVELPSEENHYAVETKPEGRTAPVEPSAKQVRKASRNKAREPHRTG